MQLNLSSIEYTYPTAADPVLPYPVYSHAPRVAVRSSPVVAANEPAAAEKSTASPKSHHLEDGEKGASTDYRAKRQVETSAVITDRLHNTIYYGDVGFRLRLLQSDIVETMALLRKRQGNQCSVCCRTCVGHTVRTRRSH